MELNSDTVNNKEFLLSKYFLFLELEINAHNIERNAEHIRKISEQSAETFLLYVTFRRKLGYLSKCTDSI